MKSYITVILVLSVSTYIQSGISQSLSEKNCELIEKFYKNQRFDVSCEGRRKFINIGKIMFTAVLGAATITDSFKLQSCKKIGIFTGILCAWCGPFAVRLFHTLSSFQNHFTSKNVSDTITRMKHEGMASEIQVSLFELFTLYKAQAVGSQESYTMRVNKLLNYKNNIIKPLAEKLKRNKQLSEKEDVAWLPAKAVEPIFNAYKYTISLEELLPLQRTFWYAQPPTYETVKLIEYKSEDDRKILKLKKSPLTQALTLTYPLVYDPKTGYQAGTKTFI